MSCRFYQQWQDEDGVWYPAGWYESEDGEPCSPAGGGGSSGNVVITQGGGTGQSGTYNATLQAILSGLAIFQHQPYVPTQVHPVVPDVQPYPAGYNPYANQSGNYGSSNTGGNIQKFIQQNSGAVLLGVVGVALFMMRPPSRAR